MMNKMRAAAALCAAAVMTLTACSSTEQGAPSTNAPVTNTGDKAPETAGQVVETTGADITPPDFASDTRPVPDTVREVAGPLCGHTERDGRTYDIIAISGGERCAEAMEVVNDFVAADSQAVQEADDSWHALNNWRCGRGTRLEDEPADAEDYTMNCWDAGTRVLFMEKH